MKHIVFSLLVIFLAANTFTQANAKKDFSSINMIFLAEQVINSYPILKQLVHDIDHDASLQTVSLDVIRIWSLVDQFAHELDMKIPNAASSYEGTDVIVDKTLCIKSATVVANHLRNLGDEGDIVGNLQVISRIADYMPQALIDCGVPKVERKFKKYKSSYVRTKIDPESIE